MHRRRPTRRRLTGQSRRATLARWLATSAPSQVRAAGQHARQHALRCGCACIALAFALGSPLNDTACCPALLLLAGPPTHLQPTLPPPGTTPHGKPDSSRVQADQGTRFAGDRGIGSSIGTGSAAPWSGDDSIKRTAALFAGGPGAADGKLQGAVSQVRARARAHAGAVLACVHACACICSAGRSWPGLSLLLVPVMLGCRRPLMQAAAAAAAARRRWAAGCAA